MALASAKSIKHFHPEIPIYLYTDEREVESNFIDSFSIIENPNRRSKIEYLKHSPFESTLFLDADTRLINPLGDLFDWLKKYDIAMAHAMRRNTFATNQQWTVDIPNSFAQFNSGVILYRKRPKVIELFEAWQTAYQNTSFRMDQVCLRELCWKSELSIGVLPPQFNTRDEKYISFWESKKQPVKILHLDSYKKDFGIKPERKKQRSFTARIKNTWGEIWWVLRQPISWKARLFRND